MLNQGNNTFTTNDDSGTVATNLSAISREATAQMRERITELETLLKQTQVSDNRYIYSFIYWCMVFQDAQKKYCPNCHHENQSNGSSVKSDGTVTEHDTLLV